MKLSNEVIETGGERRGRDGFVKYVKVSEAGWRYALSLESDLAQSRADNARLMTAWYDCPQDSVPDVLQDVFTALEANDDAHA